MTETHVRQGTLDDVPQIAECFAKGFIDDDVFGRFMHPKRHEYPDDWLRHWNKDIRNHVLDPSGTCLVRTDDEGVVKGCTFMVRLGKGGEANAAAETVTHAATRHGYAAQDKLEESIWTHRSADKKTMEIFDRNWDNIKHHFTGSREECWFVELLCIHPDSQRRGYGRDLLNAALEICKAEEPAVPLSIIASEIGDPYYEKFGFREVGRANVGEMSGVQGGSLKFYEHHLR